MNINAAVELYAGGPGSGCHGPNCGRPSGSVEAPPAAKIPPGKTTEEVFRNSKTGEWEAEREVWHQALAESYIAGKQPVQGRAPKAIILGGGTASGKSTLARKLGADSPEMVHVDADSIKPAIPEYEQLKTEEGTERPAGTRVHEEASYVAKLAMAKAAARKLDIIYDATSSGKGGATINGIVARLKAEGYDVHGLFADVPEEIAIKRAEERANDPSDPAGHGRHIPASAMHETHVGSAANFMLIRHSPMFKSIRLYDTSGELGSEPKPIYQRNEGVVTHVHDPEKWAYYKKKAAQAI